MLSASIKCKKLDLARTNRLSIDYSTLLFLLFYYNDNIQLEIRGVYGFFWQRNFFSKKRVENWIKFCLYFISNKSVSYWLLIFFSQCLMLIIYTKPFSLFNTIDIKTLSIFLDKFSFPSLCSLKSIKYKTKKKTIPHRLK